MANFLRMVSEYGLAETTTPHIHVVERTKMTPSTQFLRQCLSENIPILVKGPRNPESWREGVTKENLATFGIVSQRPVKSFGETFSGVLVELH